jgi:hypothetical protein
MPASRPSRTIRPRAVRLAHLHNALAAHGYDTEKMPNYSKLYRDALRGAFPANADNGVWETTEAAIPQIAMLYDLPLAG